MVQKLFVAALLLAVPAFCQEPAAGAKPASKEQVRRLVKALDMEKQIPLAMNAVITQMKTSQSGIPDTFWDSFAKEIDPNQFIDLLGEVYTRHLTSDEIEDVIRFYASPTGKKMAEKQPAIAQDMMAAGMKIGQEMARKVAEKMKAEGLN